MNEKQKEIMIIVAIAIGIVAVLAGIKFLLPLLKPILFALAIGVVAFFIYNIVKQDDFSKGVNVSVDKIKGLNLDKKASSAAKTVYSKFKNVVNEEAPKASEVVKDVKETAKDTAEKVVKKTKTAAKTVKKEVKSKTKKA